MYQRHLATHDDDPEADCTCYKCPPAGSASSAPASDSDSAAKPAAKRPRGRPPKKVTAEGMLESMKKNFFAEDEEAKDEEEEGLQFECALCVFKFDSPEELESHVKTHYNKEAADMEKRVEAAAAAAQGGASGVMKVEAPPISAAAAAAGAAATAKLRLTDNADRNWAAEFGYGKTTTSRPAGDLFLKMKSKFQLGGGDEEEEGGDDDVTVVDPPVGVEPKTKAAEGEDDDADQSFKIFRARGFTGKVKASPKKVPRTLSNASLATRRRLETLIKRAREHQERNKTGAAAKASKSGAAKKKKKEQQQSVTIAPPKEKKVGKRPTRSSTRKVGARAATSVRAGNGGGGGSNSVDEDEGDEEEEEEDDDDSGTFDGFADEDEAILFPLENGWVMERTPKSGSSPSSFFTSFWSPEGRQFEDLEDIRSYCKAEKVALDVGVFERAVKRVAGKKGG